MKRIKQRLLQFEAGSSDRVYEVDLVEVGPDRFLVNFRAGRLGKSLRTGSKTVLPVPRSEAEPLFDKLVESRLEKGYVDQAKPPEVEEALEVEAEEISEVEVEEISGVEEPEASPGGESEEPEASPEVEEPSASDKKTSSSLEDQVGYQDKVMRVELDAVPTELGSTEPDTEIIDGEGKPGGDEASAGEAKATKKWWEFWK